MSAAESGKRETGAWQEQWFEEASEQGTGMFWEGDCWSLDTFQFYRECPGIGCCAARFLGETTDIYYGFSELCSHRAGPFLLAMWQLYI